jgi:hypothetical protein
VVTSLFTQMEEVSLASNRVFPVPAPAVTAMLPRARPPVPVLWSDSFSSHPLQRPVLRSEPRPLPGRLGRIHNRCRLFPRHPARPRTGHSEDARAAGREPSPLLLACPTPGFLQVLPLVQ